MDFASEIKQLVIDTARRTAEEVVERSVDAITSLRERAAEFVGEAEALTPRVKAALTFVESAQKAGAIPFIGAATRTMFTSCRTADGNKPPYQMRLSDADGGFWEISGANATLPPGRYNVVLSFYKQS